LLFLVELDERGPLRLQAVPLTLELAHTRLASPDETEWIAGRFQHACAEFGTEVRRDQDRLLVSWPR
jgi:poly-gamma-glutamate synthesis protein (capsule biosynthesis protein)